MEICFYSIIATLAIYVLYAVYVYFVWEKQQKQTEVNPSAVYLFKLWRRIRSNVCINGPIHVSPDETLMLSVHACLHVDSIIPSIVINLV